MRRQVGDAVLGLPVGLSRNDVHEYFWRPSADQPAIGPIPSVTGILRAIDKSGPLIGWAKRVTAETAVDNLAKIPDWIQIGGRSGAIKLLVEAATAQRDAAADLGSRVHVIAEQLSRKQPVTITEQEAPFVQAYQAFLHERKPRFLAAEEMVVNLTAGYAGTLDWIAEIDGVITIGDNKTSKGTYAETACQLAAYANAEWIGRPGIARKYRIPRPTAYAVLHLRPEGYELKYYDVTAEEFDVFLGVLRTSKWLSGKAKSVMGIAGPKALEGVA